MHKETIEIYICQYCGFKHPDKGFMEKHEEVCLKNPTNQPCSECEHHILGIGCSKGMNMDSVGGNVLCFFYKKGQPKNLLTMMDGGKKNDPNS